MDFEEYDSYYSLEDLLTQVRKNKAESGTGGNTCGLKFDFFDLKNKAKNEIFKRLTFLRKYSKMHSKGGNFYFTFVPKYLGRIMIYPIETSIISFIPFSLITTVE